jgi:hypothetical protein
LANLPGRNRTCDSAAALVIGPINVYKSTISRVHTVLENPGKSLNLLKKIQAWKVLGK